MLSAYRSAYQRHIGIVMLAVFVSTVGPWSISYAETVSMEAMQEEFQQKTGKRWEEASREEKANFIHGYHKREEEETWKGKEKKYYPTADKQDNLALTAPLHIRKSFLAQKGKHWEEAALEEQKAFVQKFREEKVKRRKKEEKIAQAKEKQRIKNEDRKRKEVQQRKRQKEKEELRKRKEKEQLEKKRQKERKKVDAMFKQFNKLHR